MKRKVLLFLCLSICCCALAGCGKAEEDAAPESSSVAAVSEEPEASASSEEEAAEPSSEPEEKDPEPENDLEPEEDTLPVSAENDLFAAYREQAAQLAGEMTVEQKVWQVFLAAIPKGTDAAEFAAAHPAGGYLLFRWDFDDLDADGVRAKTAALAAGGLLPLIAVDEEGGTVVRVSSHTALRETPFAAPSVLWAQGGADAVYSDGLEKGRFLSDLGINLCLSPVADVSEDPGDYIYSRTIGRSAQETSGYVTAAVTGLQAGGVGATLKHFPGYGNNLNTHTGIAVDERPLSELESEDLLPFAAGIEAGCGCVLVSHNIVTAFDAEHPASLSEEVHRYLREEMGFTGLIVTDDLIMDAITDYAGDTAPSVAALQAGNDLLIHSNAEEGVRDVLAALEDGTLGMDVLDRAVLQVIAYKLFYQDNIA